MTRAQKNTDDKKAILSQDISILEYRFSNLLRREGINTIWDLTRLTHKDLLNIRGIGDSRCKQLIDKLKERGINLKKCDEDSILEMKFKRKYSLRRFGIKKVKDLTYYTEKQILGIYRMGPELMKNLKSEMKEYGISFKKDDGN